MVIDGNNPINSSTLGSSRGKQAVSGSAEAKTSTAAKTGASTQESVSLSQQGQNLSKLEANIQNAPAVNEDRVAALKKAVADGSYQINATSIAGKLLSQDQLFS